MTARHYLISRTDNLGDVVLTLPMLVLLKQEQPNCRITLLTRNYAKELAQQCPAVDDFLSWDELQQQSETKQIHTLQNLHIDAVLHVFPNKKIATLCKKAKIPLRIGTNRRAYHWWTCNKLVNLTRKNTHLHEAQLNLKLLKALGIKTNYALQDIAQWDFLHTNQTVADNVRSFLDKNKFNVILHPGSNGNSIEWPAEYFTKLAQLLSPEHYNVILTGSPAEAERFADSIIKHCPNAQNSMGKLSLAELIDLIGQVDAIVVGGTGPLHIGAALGTRTLGFFPAFQHISSERWGPLGKRTKALDAKAGLSREECMYDITPEAAFDVIKVWQQNM